MHQFVSRFPLSMSQLARGLCAAASVAVLSACAPMSSLYSQDALPDGVKVPAGHRVVAQTVGVGEITYECRAKKDMAGQFEWYELIVQPGGALESQAHEPGSREHLSVLSGTLDVSVGESVQRLKSGETARYAVDQPHTIRNPGKGAATALLVVVHP